MAKKPSEMTVEELQQLIALKKAEAEKEAEAARLKAVPDAAAILVDIADLRAKLAGAESQLKPVLATLADAGGKPDDIRAALVAHFGADVDITPLMVTATVCAPDGWARKPKAPGAGTSKPRPWHYVASFVDSKSKGRDVSATGGAVYTKAREAAEAMGLPRDGGREDIPDELKARILGWIEASPMKA